MNKDRRERLIIICKEIEKQVWELSNIQSEEEDALYNMPVSLHCSPLGEKLEENTQLFEDAGSEIEAQIAQILEL